MSMGVSYRSFPPAFRFLFFFLWGMFGAVSPFSPGSSTALPLLSTFRATLSLFSVSPATKGCLPFFRQKRDGYPFLGTRAAF